MFNLLLNNNNKYMVTCNMGINGLPLTSKGVEMVVDTGAAYTSCRYDAISTRIKEAYCTGNRKRIGGFIKGGTSAWFHQLAISEIILQDDLKVRDVNVWVTFEEIDVVSVLGMDILSRVLFLNDKKKLTFCSEHEELYRLLGTKDRS